MDINETLIMEILNITRGMSETQAAQSSNYIFYLIISLIGGSMIYFILMMPTLINIVQFKLKVSPLIKKYSNFAKRNVIVMSHIESGLFGSMITMHDVIKIERLIRKYGGKNIDLIINTFGGDLLASMRLATLIKTNNIRVVIPKYAWSGGTLATLASSEILMNKDATLSPVDPQLGTFLKIYSAKYWKEIVRKKGMKADDESIAMSKMSKEIMEEMKRHIKTIKPNARKRLLDLFLTGSYTHANQIMFTDAKKVGLPVSELKSTLPSEIIENMKKDGVVGIRYKK